MHDHSPRVAILGAGPVGLDAALAAADAGFPFAVYEASSRVGANVRRWGHVRMFSPWDLNVSPRMMDHLDGAGLPVPRGPECPTGRELYERLLAPLAGLPALAGSLRAGVAVRGVGRDGLLKHEEIATPGRRRRPFRLLLRDTDAREWVERADVVLDCTGTYHHPNALGDGGIPAPGEEEAGSRIVRRIPDMEASRHEWLGRIVLLVGAGHSAATAARDLAEAAEGRGSTRVLWALRSERPTWGAVAGDPLAERARLVAVAEQLAGGASPAVEAVRGVVVESLEPVDGKLRVRLRAARGRDEEELVVDRVLALTGSTGDHRIYRQLQVHECYATSGPMKLSAALLGESAADCLEQRSHGVDALRSPEPDFYLLGAKSYGRNNTFLLRVGWQQVDEVFGALRQEAG